MELWGIFFLFFACIAFHVFCVCTDTYLWHWTASRSQHAIGSVSHKNTLTLTNCTLNHVKKVSSKKRHFLWSVYSNCPWLFPDFSPKRIFSRICLPARNGSASQASVNYPKTSFTQVAPTLRGYITYEHSVCVSDSQREEDREEEEEEIQRWRRATLSRTTGPETTRAEPREECLCSAGPEDQLTNVYTTMQPHSSGTTESITIRHVITKHK